MDKRDARLLHGLVFALLLAAVTTAQSPAYCGTKTRWPRCSSARGRFSVRLPGRVVRAVRTIEGPGKHAVRMVSISGENAEASYLVAYADYGAAARSLSARALLSKICQGVLKSARARSVRQQRMRYYGHTGIEIHALRDPLVDESTCPYLHARCFVVGTRGYTLLQAGTLREPNPRFFGSFRLLRSHLPRRQGKHRDR